jgi:hypothetical protein
MKLPGENILDDKFRLPKMAAFFIKFLIVTIFISLYLDRQIKMAQDF